MIDNLDSMDPRTFTQLVYELRNCGKFHDHTVPYTPGDLMAEITSNLAINENSKVAVMYTVEWALYLKHMLNVKDITVIGGEFCRSTEICCNLWGFKYILGRKIGNDMKFDVVVGNPPFQKEDNKAKRWTLWEEFIKESLTLSDNVAMIVPQSFTGPNKVFNQVKKNISLLNVDVDKHFSVGSTFCYFVLDKTQEFNTTKIISADGEFDIDLHNLSFLPKEVNAYTLSLINTLASRTRREWRRGELHTSDERKFDDNGMYDVIHTNAQTKKTNIIHPNKDKIRVVITLSGYPTFKVIENAYCSQACMWTEFENRALAEQFAAECNGEAVQELMNVFKWSGWNSKEVIEML
jgi:hypothetical protein